MSDLFDSIDVPEEPASEAEVSAQVIREKIREVEASVECSEELLNRGSMTEAVAETKLALERCGELLELVEAHRARFGSAKEGGSPQS